MDKKEYRRKYCEKNRDKINVQKRAAYWKDPAKARRQMRDWHKNRADELRQQIIDAYGGKCTCCGESELVFLTIEHLNGDGRKHRGNRNRYMVYKDIVEEGFPDKYTILCMNCNFARRWGRTCPHQLKK
jgi:hypothetical protein